MKGEQLLGIGVAFFACCCQVFAFMFTFCFCDLLREKGKKKQGFKEIDGTVVERRNWASCAAPENNRPSLNSPGGALVCFVFVSISSIAPLSDQIIQGECVCFQL